MKRLLSIILATLALTAGAAPKKTVYMTFILHGNMNYDRYVRPVIWKEFPVIYDNLLTFMDAHPDFKGQVQFSGQTFGSLQQAAPEVIAHAKAIHDRGQINFTGTFYSEPVNVNMDGETNFRCAWLGTGIIEDAIGETDGFYLQERAYHPQLPWILNHANVSWTPVITGDDSWYPFRLRGLDGSVTVCVPVTRGDCISRAENAPDNALITIEEDYEIPQTFTRAYDRVRKFNASHKDTRIEWITVREYVKRFGVKEEKYVDHNPKAASPEQGTYSRWTADPLDIRVQECTNRAMGLFRIANAVDAIARRAGAELDEKFDESGLTLIHDPLTWNIERPDLYPDHEKYLKRRGETTILSKAEHLLLWAVNSDAKGWFPLYEKRRERVNSLENCSALSACVINRGLDLIGSKIAPAGYDSYYAVLNAGAARTVALELDSDGPCEVYDPGTGRKLRSSCLFDGSRALVDFELELPAYGYAVVATCRSKAAAEVWTEGTSISNAGMQLETDGVETVLRKGGKAYGMRLDGFQLKALAHMDFGPGDSTWRPAKEYGKPRVSVNTDGLYPRLRVERQPDYLVHLRQEFTLLPDRVRCEMSFVFPHPAVVRRDGAKYQGRTDFRPEGLDLIISSGEPCELGFDIPFGISEMSRPGVTYFCPLTSCFTKTARGGILLCPGTGEQAFSLDADSGELTMFLGASTTSGPIREMGLGMQDPTTAVHDFEWYAEPFHGTYRHCWTLVPYSGNWKDAHLPKIMGEEGRHAVVRRIYPSGSGRTYRMSLIEGVPDNVDISGIFEEDGILKIRFNEREGRRTVFDYSLMGEIRRETVGPYGISD